MIRQGLLDKYGKVNDKTPAGWQSAYVDYNKCVTRVLASFNAITFDSRKVSRGICCFCRAKSEALSSVPSSNGEATPKVETSKKVRNTIGQPGSVFYNKSLKLPGSLSSKFLNVSCLFTLQRKHEASDSSSDDGESATKTPQKLKTPKAEVATPSQDMEGAGDAATSEKKKKKKKKEKHLDKSMDLSESVTETVRDAKMCDQSN